jgi:4-amino-4-deoxy-L-arabinose transferase-like glycosyltransferase
MRKVLSASAERSATSVNTITTPEPSPSRYGVVLLLAAALIIRLLVFFAGVERGTFYPDESEYMELAKNLANDQGFSYKGNLTSFRPPGFPFLISLVFRLFDSTSPVPVRAMQILFSLATVWVIYRLGRDGWGEKVGLLAAGIFAFYPSLIGFNNILLSEPSYIFFISLTCWMMLRHLQKPSIWWVAGSGVSMGLGVLIRDTLFYAGPVTILFLIGHAWRDRRYGWRHVWTFAGGFLLVIAPWSVRNTLLHGQLTTISTVGGINLYLCNQDETPLIHPGSIFIERAQQGHDGYYYDSLFPELDAASETAKQNLAMRKGLEYMLANPGITALRSLVRFVDFWGQERLVINQVMSDYYGKASLAVLLAVIAAIFVSYSGVVVSACFGYSFAKLRPFDVYGLVFIAYYAGMHTLVLGIPRYHIPLLPFLAVVAARAFLMRSAIWANRRSWRFAAAMAAVAIFAIMWTVGIFYFDADKARLITEWMN